jgi:hypothetical protein
MEHRQYAPGQRSEFANFYPAGTLEWEAWGMGDDYGSAAAFESDEPLSGEWAGDILPREVIRGAWERVLGMGYDTYASENGDDRDADSDILDAWETGYRHAWEARA